LKEDQRLQKRQERYAREDAKEWERGRLALKDKLKETGASIPPKDQQPLANEDNVGDIELEGWQSYQMNYLRGQGKTRGYLS
jgi:hypothetical protein